VFIKEPAFNRQSGNILITFGALALNFFLKFKHAAMK
jgi:hypothetical protein